MNKKRNKLFVSILLILCLLLLCKRLTGELCHVILGMILLSMAVVHVCRHIGKLKYREGSVRITDWVMMIALIVVFVSGIMLHPLKGILIILIIHKMSSVVFVLGMIIHMVQHRQKKNSSR